MMMMTKPVKVAVSLSLIVIVITFVSLNVYLTRLSQNDDYIARKNELLSQQQRLELMIENLNTTLQAEKTNFLRLTEQLQESQSVQTAPTISEPVQTAPTPPQPRRVTRAS